MSETGRNAPPKSVAIVVTTIGDGSFLDALRPVLELSDGSFNVIVIGDLKTPASCPEAVARFKSEGFSVTWFGPDEQREWLSQVPDFAPFVPWNSDNRRNLGVLEAWRQGKEIIVSLDDDNAPLDAAEFVKLYRDTGGVLRGREVQSDNRWINLCAFLDCKSSYNDSSVAIYPRGYPILHREQTIHALRKIERQHRSRFVLDCG